MNAEVKPGYKLTEVGVIPEDWECTTVQGIASSVRNAIVGGPFGSDLVSDDYVSYGVPVIRGQNMGTRWVSGAFVFVSNAKADSLESNLAHPFDLIFTQRGTLGQVSQVPEKLFDRYLVSQSQMKLTLNRKIADPNFFYYVFSSKGQQELIRKNTIQTGIPHINLGILRTLPVQRPTYLEQRAIAEALSDADALIESLEQLITKKRQIKQGAMQELLTGKKRLPGFSGEWEGKKLGDVSEMGSGGTPASSFPDYYDGDIPWVSISDMTKGGKVIQSTDRNLSGLGFANSAAQMFPAGTVLYAMYASLGECSIAGISLCSSQAILGIRPKETLESEFLYYFLTSLKTIVKSMGQQGTQSNLNKAMVQAFQINLPTFSEQTAIAKVLSDMDNEIDMLEIKLEKILQLKQGMMYNLLTGKIRIV
ncbi:MAG: hypothetical protein FDX21_10250 [Chlorobium sp.]|nr:MAG: hypothetical protein FDX21_10250 [Chlorobium sp.]